MSPTKRYAKKQAKARQRRRRTAHERLERDRRQAQRAVEAFQQALEDLGLPHRPGRGDRRPLTQPTAAPGQNRRGDVSRALWLSHALRAVSRAGLGQELALTPLGALPKRSWLKRLRRLGLEVLVPLWRHVASKSPATQSRWQWTWASMIRSFKKYGEQLGLVGRWWSGQQHRVLSGIDGLLLVVVIGDGKLVVPVDFAIRRPDPIGAGAPCRDKLRWAQAMLDERLAALRRRGLELPPPMVVGDSWFSDSKLMRMWPAHQGTLLVEGKSTYAFTLADGRQVKGQDLHRGRDWPWREHPWEPRVRYVRLRATSPTYGPVTVVIVDEPGQDRFYLLCLETTLSGPQLIRRWRRRNWIEFVFRMLKHLLATRRVKCTAKTPTMGIWCCV